MMVITILFWLALVMLGACIGSFIEVILQREAHHDHSWLTGRSRCDACRAKIAWYDNIPLVSYWILGGKCRSCQSDIAAQNWWMEVIFGAIFGFWGWFCGRPLINLIFTNLSYDHTSYDRAFFVNLIVASCYLLILICLGVISIIDWRKKIIPNSLLIAILIFGVMIVIFDWQSPDLLSSFSLGISSFSIFLWRLLTAGITGAIFYLVHLLTLHLYQQDAFGLGDVKFLSLSAFFLGWPAILWLIVIGFGMGSIFGLAQVLIKKAKLRSQIPLGPFLCLGLVLAFMFSPLLANYLNLDLLGTLNLL